MGCGGIFLLVIVSFLCLYLTVQCCIAVRSNEKAASGYSGNSGISKTCQASGCRSARTSGSNYCYEHTCHETGCYEKTVSISQYCSRHQPKTATDKPKTSSKKNTEKNDPYNISQYIDVDDFYDDWYDDFDGFDDAEWYWDENH